MSKSLSTTKEWGNYLAARTSRLDEWSKGTGLDGRTLTRVALRELGGNSKLRQCSPESVYLALTIAAQLGLDPTGVNGEAYLVPFKGQCKLMPGYQGLIKLAYQSGRVKDIWAEVVRDGDIFRVVKGTDPGIAHEPMLDSSRAVIATYACAEYEHGRVHFEAMDVNEIEKARAVSRGAGSGPWSDWYEEMARKTVIRRLAKYLPKSQKLKDAIAVDTAFETGQSVQEVIDVPDDAVVEEPSSRGADELKQKLGGT